jgi:hypothetical protein
MSYEMRFHCDLCEQTTSFVSHRADLSAGQMLIVGSQNVGTICDACAQSIVGNIEARRALLVAPLKPAKRKGPVVI